MTARRIPKHVKYPAIGACGLSCKLMRGIIEDIAQNRGYLLTLRKRPPR